MFEIVRGWFVEMLFYLQVEVINTAYKRSSDIEQEKIFQRKNKMHIGNDRYYNVNLTKEKAFRLKKI